MDSMVRRRIRVVEDCLGRKGLRQQAATRLCVCESEDVYNNDVVCMLLIDNGRSSDKRRKRMGLENLTGQMCYVCLPGEGYVNEEECGNTMGRDGGVEGRLLMG